MILRHVLALAAFLLVFLFAPAACAPDLSFEVDAAFTTDDLVQIQLAADAWNKRTLPEYKITFDGDNWRIAKEDPGPGVNGRCSSSKDLIQIRPTPINATIYDVAVHEFGHALGLRHTTTGLMYPTSVSSEFTPEVMAECRRVGACA